MGGDGPQAAGTVLERITKARKDESTKGLGEQGVTFPRR